MIPLLIPVIGGVIGYLAAGSKKFAQGGEVLPNGTMVKFKDFKGNQRSGEIIEHRSNGYIVATNIGHALVQPREIVETFAKGGQIDLFQDVESFEDGGEYGVGGFIAGAALGTYAGYKLKENYEVKKNPTKKQKYAKGGSVGEFHVGQSVMIDPDNDNDNYDDYRDMELVITHKATNSKQHRGFDESMQGMGLYDLQVRKTGESVPFSLYDYELIQY